MNLVDFASTPLSLVPALVALGLAIITRKVLLSLGLGIIIGAFLLANYSSSTAFSYILKSVSAVFIEDGGINSWNMSIVAFLLLLGSITALLSLSGGTHAFANWAMTKVESKRGSKLLAAFLGVFIFVDDYFNSLAVGTVSRPVTDRYKVSRAKLAYILDSTAAPTCVLVPISSWGAYIMTIVAGILTAHGINEYSPLGAYIALVPINLYAVFALLMVFAVCYFNINLGPMKRHEQLALDNKDPAIIPLTENEQQLELSANKHGKVSDLFVPIITLIVATVASMIFTGATSLSSNDKPFSIIGAFENTDVGMSLVYGGLIGLAVTLITVFKQKHKTADIGKTMWIGAKSMFTAILILIFAWTIGTVIGDMKTGTYLSSLAKGNIAPQLFPVILFLLAGFMAFATGTSWGTFGIMLPIAGDISAATDITMMLPMLGAVLAGAVFGDHCSPISDTTILSSTGARCNHIEHVATQLPYALSIATISAIGFIVMGYTQSVNMAFLMSSICFIALVGFLKNFTKSHDLIVVNP